MRHLNEIIFLNSANIPYAEVMLDGNVHFSGTQGVGKSTVLRALLFFYNADKMRLGIQQGHKSFEEFYFRYSNSYIVYEVKTDHGAYCILTSRSQGKIVYRFIDAPYRKEWFVGVNGRVESDWIRIRERIGTQVDISAKIDTYELYRNIIFGNTHDRSHRYDKYAIVESARYQNIPRSIQNVFLNSKLDADFVKNTIIQSMADTEDAISLVTYRHLVADFEREFDEIDCWYKKDVNGEIVVRGKADKVIEAYRLLQAFEHEMKQTWHKLNYAVNHTREQIPFVEDEIKGLQEKIKKLKEKLDGNQQEYSREHESLLKKINTCEVRLGDIRSKRKRYEEVNIQTIIELDARQQELLKEKVQKENLLRTLQDNYADIAEKYSRIYAELGAEWSSFEQSQTEALQRMRDELQSERDRYAKQRDKLKKDIEDAYSEWLSASDGRMSILQEDYNRTDKRLAEIKFLHPMKAEMDACEEDIQKLNSLEKECRSNLQIVRNELAGMRQEGMMKRKEIESAYALKQDLADKELKQLAAELAETEEMLMRWDGSFYQWLSNNKPGWEDNIGKVIDEQHVLYAQGLNPALSDNGSFFGVNLDLDAIPSHHRTPDEYRVLRKEQAEAVAAKRKELADLQAKCQDELDAISKSYKGKLSEKQQEETFLRIQVEQIPLKQKDAETRLRQLQHKEKELIDLEQKKRTSEYNEALLKLEQEKKVRTQQRDKRDKDMKRVDNGYSAALKESEKRLDAFKRTQSDEKSEKHRDIDDRKKMIEQQEHDELKGRGADTRAIELCRKDIQEVQHLLDKIADQHHWVIEYRKDEVELFSRESEFKDEKHRLEVKDSMIFQTFEDKRKRYENEQTAKSISLKKQVSLLENMSEGLKQYEQLCKIENIVPETFMQDDFTEKNCDSCAELVGLMRGAVNKKRMKQVELKRLVNAFNSHFGPNNTFHFIVPQYDEDYLEFAVNLQEFVDNNKIEDYRERVSEHYNTILSSISREVGLLMNHSAEIKGIINDVNRDFRERNFAGVIRNIELRAEESSDHLMSLLQSIRDFTEENSLSIGEVNLFSGDDRDQVNLKVVDYLRKFMKCLQKEPSRMELTLSDTFRLQFRIQENDNTTGWVERINNVGSDGTDILVKAMVNIMLINVFKTKASRKNGDFVIHCMMDEIGKLHPSNVVGILQFANVRNIYLINSSPMGYNADIYKYNYLLTKDSKSRTHVNRLTTISL